MRLSGSLAALAVLAAASWGGCDARSLTPNTGTAGAGGSTGGPDEPLLAISDFEDLQLATVVQSSGRNGYWYAYNDGRAGCAQMPLPGAVYVGAAPPALYPGSSGSLALHGSWRLCDVWGAGIGADFAVPFTSAITYTGPKVAYDVTPYIGIAFWAMSAPGSDTLLRVKFPMRATTRIQDGGMCDEAVVGPNRCSDDWGEQIRLSTDGSWKRFVMRFTDVAFTQEGWGALLPWNPADVTGIQIQSVDKGAPYDFWIDDVDFLLR